MKILSNRVALAFWLLLLQATGIHASCFPPQKLPLTQNKTKKITPPLRKSQRHIKSLWTLNRGLFTLKHFNLTGLLYLFLTLIFMANYRKVTQKQKTIKYQLQRGMINLNYLMIHILYLIFKIILSISLKRIKIGYYLERFNIP